MHDTAHHESPLCSTTIGLLWWSAFKEVNCNHERVLAPSCVPGKSKVPVEKANCDMVWNYLVTAFALKASQEALLKKKKKEGKYKFHLVVQAMAVG